METSPKHQTTTETTSTTSSSNSNNGLQFQPPLTPKPITRSESTAYPTTFVQADSCSFKQVVQMLTGSSQTVLKQSTKTPTKTGPKKQGFKLYERRTSLKNINISPLLPELVQKCVGFSPRKQELLLSPSMLDFPSLVLSPVTPLNSDSSYRYPLTPSTPSSSSSSLVVVEERLMTPRDAEPRLLPLFPTTSTRVTGSST